MGNQKRKAVESQLERLMMHILKYFIQPTKRTMSWIFSINNAREEINKYTRKKPSLKNYILSTWNDVFHRAKREAEKETNQKCDIDELDWETVFNKKFGFDDEGK